MAMRIEFISDGFKQILLSKGCEQLVKDITDEIADKADANNTRGGAGFSPSVKYIVGGYGGGRWLGFVGTTDKQSAQAESEELALTRAVTQ